MERISARTKRMMEIYLRWYPCQTEIDFITIKLIHIGRDIVRSRQNGYSLSTANYQ